MGLADVLIRQLSNTVTTPASEKPWKDRLNRQCRRLPPPAQAPHASRTSASQPTHAQAFQTRLGPHAEEASRTTGIPAKFMLGQAALESGWGKRELVAADGTPSHNLFGIKADAGWHGKVVEHLTTEYVHGVAQKKVQTFRAYDNYADAFRDYAHLLRSNPRYQQVLASAQDATGFAQGLQRAGYATDPHYADKLTRIITQSSDCLRAIVKVLRQRADNPLIPVDQIHHGFEYPQHRTKRARCSPGGDQHDRE